MVWKVILPAFGVDFQSKPLHVNCIMTMEKALLTVETNCTIVQNFLCGIWELRTNNIGIIAFWNVMECSLEYVYVYTHMFQKNLLPPSSVQIYHDYRERKSLWHATTYPPNYTVFHPSHCHVYKTSNLKSHDNINQEEKHVSKVMKIISFT